MPGWARRISSLAAAGLFVGLAGTAKAALPTLYVNYNASNCTFTVTNDAATTVTTLAPGSYEVEISTFDPWAFVGSGSPGSLQDCGGYAQFSMTGPGVNLMTTLGEGDVSSELDSVTLQAGGTYTMEDASNVAGSKTTLVTSTTGSAGSVSGPSSSSSSSSSSAGSSSSSTKTSAIGTKIPGTTVLRGTLVGAVAASGKVTLTLKGKPVEDLTAGRYAFSIVDQSRSTGFTLQAVHSAPIIVTGGEFVGKHTTSITLNSGQWLYYGTVVGKKTYFIVTT